MLSTPRYIEIFHPEASARLNELVLNGRDLVHYTSAENAIRILREKEITLRNASLMNDFSEIDHGEKCVLRGWQSDLGRGTAQPYKGRLVGLLNKISPTIFPAIEQAYDEALFNRKSNTFILSLAEHDEKSEGKLGRLSMWRAYGGRTNVAIVVSSDFMLGESAGGLFSAPVTYCSQDEFVDSHFLRIVESLEKNITEIAALDRDYIVRCIEFTFNQIAMTTKHPGFAEEKEWRILYAPWMNFNSDIVARNLVIAGIPQKAFVSKIDVLRGKLDSPIQFNDLLKKIIIGPTEHPWVVYEAFVRELEEAGIQDAGTKVVVSDIPIRR